MEQKENKLRIFKDNNTDTFFLLHAISNIFRLLKKRPKQGLF